MVKITDDYKQDEQAFAKAGIEVPTYSQAEVAKKTLAAPRWVHFGGGNLFRAFHAAIASHLIDAGKLDEGIIVVDTHDDSIIENVYKKFNNRMLRVITKADGSQDRELFAPVADAIYAGPVTDDTSSLEKLKDIFNQASLQLATFSITEKGYALKDAEGDFFAPVAQDIENGPAKPQNNMSLLVTLLLSRFKNGATPIALFSTDNFSENGDKLKDSVLTIAKAWQKNGFVDQDFIDYLSDDSKVSFPLSMIDRITPNPSATVSESLKKDGFEDADLIHTESHTTIASFTNTEEAHYLVVEDKFPNGRPAFEDDGVIMTDRDTVNLADQMKVTACFNPLHTALAIYGTILNFKSISSEVQDPDMKRLILQIGYGEDLPVVQDPKVLSPRDFIDELVNKRLPNPYIPDTPQRIAADTSQKVGIRYGVTIQHYVDDPKRNPADLNFIPLVIATWLRYLMGINDEGEKFQPSPDPLWDDLHAQVADIKFGDANQDVHDAVKGILSNKSIFGNDRYAVGLGDKIESDFKEMLAGKGTIRKTLQKHLDEESKNFD